MGITLRRRHPGVSENLLHHADVRALLDQQRRGGMPGIVDPGIPHLRLAQDSLPGSPILSALDGAAMAGREHQIMVRPRTARSQPLGGLPPMVLPQQLQERGRTLERELTLALALPKNDAASNTVRALVRMPGAGC